MPPQPSALGVHHRMLRFRLNRAPPIPFRLAVVAIVACGNRATGPEPPSSRAADTTTITVDNTVTRQTIDGFGGTTLPLVYLNGDHLGSYRAAAIRAAFRDVGISRGMLAIGVMEAPANASDPYAQRGNDNSNPFLLNPAGFNWTGSDLLRSAVLAPAAAYGYNTLDLGPLVDMRGPLDWLKAIRAVDYPRYLNEVAEVVQALLQQWRDAYGVTPTLVHLFNEPTSGNAELGSSSAQEVVDLVKTIGPRLQAAGFAGVKFVVPNEESIGRSLEVAQAILADPAARPYVGVIGFHTYPIPSAYSSPRRILEASGNGAPDPDARHGLEQLKALGQQYGIPLWMTEVAEGVGINDYSFNAIEYVLARAINIHDMFEYAGASAFFGMNTIWDSQTHAEHFAGRGVPFLSERSGMVLVDVGTGEIRITGMGYAVGHYARWLRPGVVRIEASSGKPRVLVSAFRDLANRRIVVVAVNNELSEQFLQIRLTGASAGGAVSGEVTSGQVRWQAIPNFVPSSNSTVGFVAPARSVVTLAIPTG